MWLNFDWAALNTSEFNLNETKFKDFNREENKALTLRDFLNKMNKFFFFLHLRDIAFAYHTIRPNTSMSTQ